MLVPDVPDNQLESVTLNAGLDVAVLDGGVVIIGEGIEADDSIAAIEQFLAQVTADETGAASGENAATLVSSSRGVSGRLDTSVVLESLPMEPENRPNLAVNLVAGRVRDRCFLESSPS